MQTIKAIKIGLLMAMSFVIQRPLMAETGYPAAYFEPYIVYQAPEISATTPAAGESNASGEAATDATSEPEEADPYPAAYFQPVIVYQDKEWIAAQAKGQKAAAAKQASAKVGVSLNKPLAAKSTPSVAPITDDGGFPISVLFLIAALAGGFYRLMKMDKNKVAPVASAVETDEVGGDKDDGNEDEESDDSAEQAESLEASSILNA